MLHCDHRGGSKKASQPCCKKLGATVITDECPKNLIFSPYVEALHEKNPLNLIKNGLIKKLMKNVQYMISTPKDQPRK